MCVASLDGANVAAGAAADHTQVVGGAFVVCLTRRDLFGPDGMPCVVLWRAEALDCRVLIPSEAWN